MARAAKTAAAIAVVVLCASAAERAVAADLTPIERLATCKDSWFDWKDDRARTAAFVSWLKTRLASDDDGQSYKPIAPMTFFGAPVLQAYPQSIGTGVGFSLLLDTDLATARRIFEEQLGRSLQCEKSDGMESCGVPTGDQRTVTLMANVRPTRPTLVGCYYFYQK